MNNGLNDVCKTLYEQVMEGFRKMPADGVNLIAPDLKLWMKPVAPGDYLFEFHAEFGGIKVALLYPLRKLADAEKGFRILLKDFFAACIERVFDIPLTVSLDTPHEP